MFELFQKKSRKHGHDIQEDRNNYKLNSIDVIRKNFPQSMEYMTIQLSIFKPQCNAYGDDHLNKKQESKNRD